MSERKELKEKHILHYYWFNNWNYSPLPDPEHPDKDENETKRLQRRLKPLEELSDKERELELRIVKDVLASFDEEDDTGPC